MLHEPNTEVRREGCVFCLWQKRDLQIGIHRVWLQSMVCVATNGALRFSCVVPLGATHFLSYGGILKMKKILSVVLVAIMLLSIAACKTSNVPAAAPTTAPTAEPKDVTITAANLKNYLAFDFTYGEKTSVNVMGTPIYSTTMQINIYPVQGGSFSNVKFDLSIPCPTSWRVAATDRAYKESDPGTIYLTITLPASGNYSTTVNLSSPLLGMNPSGTPFVNVISAEGTFRGN